MPVEPLISTPSSAVWITWWMFFLLLCLVLPNARRTDTIKDTFMTLFTPMQRSYSEHTDDWLSAWLEQIFCWGTLTMTLYLWGYNDPACQIHNYLRLGLLVAGICFVKWLIMQWVDFTFQLKQTFRATDKSYKQLWLVGYIGLYGIDLYEIAVGFHTAYPWFVVGWLSCLLLLLTIKLYRTFAVELLGGIYVLVYVATIEILPLIGLTIIKQYI